MATLTESRARPRTPSFWVAHQRQLAPWLFLAPALFMFVVFVVKPIVQTIWLSFHEYDGMLPPMWTGLDNYEELFGKSAFITALWNNVKWLLLFLLAPVFGLAIALFLNQSVWGIRFYKSMFFFPFVISQVVVGLVFSWFYDPSFGLLTQLTELVGLEPINVLGSEDYVTYGIIAAGLWPQTAYCMIIYLTGLNNVSPDQIESARIDGARGLRMLWSVILPQLRPATFIAMVITIIGALRSFDLIAVMTDGGPYGSSSVLAFYMYKQSIFSQRFGYGAAIATILFLIMNLYIAYVLFKLVRQERR